MVNTPRREESLTHLCAADLEVKPYAQQTPRCRAGRVKTDVDGSSRTAARSGVVTERDDVRRAASLVGGRGRREGPRPAAAEVADHEPGDEPHPHDRHRDQLRPPDLRAR